MKIYEVRQYRTISHMLCTYVAITTISDSTWAKIVIICVAIFANLKHRDDQFDVTLSDFNNEIKTGILEIENNDIRTYLSLIVPYIDSSNSYIKY